MPDHAIEEPLGAVGHLVHEGIDPLSTISLQHEIDVERELHDIATSVPLTGYQLADSGRHSIAQTKRDVVG